MEEEEEEGQQAGALRFFSIIEREGLIKHHPSNAKQRHP
jgi:hypothetical protein